MNLNKYNSKTEDLMNNKLQGDKKQLEELEQNRKLNAKSSMMLAGNSGSKDMAIATDITVPHKSKSKKKKKKQIVNLEFLIIIGRWQWFIQGLWSIKI